MINLMNLTLYLDSKFRYLVRDLENYKLPNDKIEVDYYITEQSENFEAIPTFVMNTKMLFQTLDR